MKGQLKIFATIIPVLFSLSYTITPVEKIMPADEKKGFVLIELYTSEGCSSCPAADEAVASLATKYEGRLFVLGFHVDYWNKLGWKDKYSNADYTDRQREYATTFSLNSIYTPQVVVNGYKQFVGSARNLLEETISSELNKPVSNTLQLIAQSTKNRMISLSYTSTIADDNNNLNIVLVQLKGITKVNSGENSGKILPHINIVRSFQSIALRRNLSGELTITLPDDLSTNQCKVIAFTQNKNNKLITSINETSILP